MSSPADDIARYFADQGIGPFGTNADWCINVGRLALNVDRAIAVYDTGGPDPLEVEDTEMRQPTIQVRVRSDSYPEAYEKQQAMFLLLAVPVTQDIGEHRYVAINLQSDILDIGRDDNDRVNLTANYQIIRQPLEGTT